jgi:hypothetical protein
MNLDFASIEKPMSSCKSCGTPISEAEAYASLYDLRFLPGPDGRRLGRRVARKRAADVGPLCAACLKRQERLPPPAEK